MATHHTGLPTVRLDLDLPGKDGLEVLRSIWPPNNPVPLRAISARDSLMSQLVYWRSTCFSGGWLVALWVFRANVTGHSG